MSIPPGLTIGFDKLLQMRRWSGAWPFVRNGLAFGTLVSGQVGHIREGFSEISLLQIPFDLSSGDPTGSYRFFQFIHPDLAEGVFIHKPWLSWHNRVVQQARITFFIVLEAIPTWWNSIFYFVWLYQTHVE